MFLYDTHDPQAYMFTVPFWIFKDEILPSIEKRLHM